MTKLTIYTLHKKRKCIRFQHAFTLIELMVVLVILGLLAGLVTVNVSGYLVKARQNTARMEIATIVNAIDTFYTVYDRYPTNEEGLSILSQASEQMKEPLLKQSPTDPWGRPYQYNQPGRIGPYEIICLGADGREGGDGTDRDIISSDLKDKMDSPGVQ